MSSVPYTYETSTLMDGVVALGVHAFPQDALGDDTVVIEPHYIGICRADVKEVIGSRDVMGDRGPLFGHELVGTVSFSGAGTGLQKGDVVTLNPNITPTRTTGFAEYVFVHGTKEVLEQTVIRVPEPEIQNSIWMPEPFACIVHALRKFLELTNLPSLAGKKVGIIGAGCAGLMFAMYARHLGASISVFNRGEMRRTFAREREILTADEIHSLEDAKAHQNEFDAVIVAPTVSSTDILETAAAMAADEAVLLVYGGTRKGDSFPLGQRDVDAIRREERIESAVHNGKRLSISGAYGCSKEDYEEGYRLHARHPHEFPLERLASRQIGLDDFPALIMGMATGAEDYPGKVLIGIGAQR
ncbi:alcohol dehydrogenase catalytic domain-containing protein [Streptomyces sp. NBC_00872]|uniref:alcohol dehydrogenase catalytic domain-containing protein n=1 Tax=Streptomyces sp. NBC_00872 TaxID=2903686 RepID=UPI0038648328|nr:alcohol dehydrogenase catalytic domain-containing protein [Streptomyces sp. NBC_00872]